MKKYFLSLLALPVILSAAAIDPLLLPKDDHLKIVVNNRVLAKVHGKPITMIDVTKRMDILFLKQFPEYTNSVQARFQFYNANWKRTLDDLIDKELVLADAKEIKMEVANGDVRQEMEELFGPNIILNLDKIGLSLDEATKIVSGDIAIRRMMFLKVTSKALGKITPQIVKTYYDQWAVKNQQPALFVYRVITVRDKDSSRGAETANSLFEDLKIMSAEDALKSKESVKDTINVSEEFNHIEKEIAPANKDILLSLSEGQISEPQAQKSRTSNSTVFRIFLLLKKTKEGAPSYNDVEGNLKGELLEIAASEEHKTYMNKLRRHYGVSEDHLKEMTPGEFTPFILQ
jgi:hypothetical protein